MAKKFPTPKKWIPKNHEKYVGDSTGIITRSSWETKFMNWADTNPQVVRWASEEISISYVSPKDGIQHRYFPDFLMEIENNSGLTVKYVVEVKPYAQTCPPKPKKSKGYLNEVMTYAINTAKWHAADEWCKRNGFEFIIITENELKV